ncbi:MAG: UDP-N-acetylmuramoyl-L-alanine--D-glutamate ligase [Ottowia sp.]|nr:UDP-N-acetylmuramoyl-L-alanine--D-glutamate ligase [Ottowia sp.]
MLILGLGISGLSMARWRARTAGAAALRVADTRAQPPALEALQRELPQAQFVSGAFSEALLEGVGEVLVSPGIEPTEPLLAAVRARGLLIHGELELFAQALHQLEAERGWQPKVLAITGTNGKTTVTALTGRLLQSAGLDAAVAGNIGRALLDELGARLDAGRLPQAWALELSSFQLHAHASHAPEAGCPFAFRPTAATVLNVTQDHLNWHGSMAAYAADKARVFGVQGTLVLCRDDAAVMAMRAGALAGRAAVTFGMDTPQVAGDFGLQDIDGALWLVRAGEGGALQTLLPVDALRIRGLHNASNALAALALAAEAGCPMDAMLQGLQEYKGEHHRVQQVGELDGVEYFDDSKGTNVGATLAAVQGLGAQRRLVVILGGDGKGQDFSPLAAPLAACARALVFIGRDGPQIRAALAQLDAPMLDAKDMNEAVQLARRHAQPGDAVLLSPACASLDMYRDYAERAQAFCDALRAQQGAAA